MPLELRHGACVKRGCRTTQGCYGGNLRRNVVGAVEPASGQLVSRLIVCHCNTEVFQAFLDVMAKEVSAAEGEQVHLILDYASWHKSAPLLVWHHTKPFYLSAYADFNPIERLWQHIKGDSMACFVTNCGEALTDLLLESLKKLLDDPQIIQSICAPPSFNRN